MSEQKIRRRRFAGRVLVFVLVLALFSLAVAANSNGKWKLSGDDGCPTGTVCADWEVDGVVQSSCCIEPQHVGTSNYYACATSRPVNQ